MAEEIDKPSAKRATGYHDIDTAAIISVDEVTRQAEAMAEKVPLEKIAGLANNSAFVTIKNLNAGYGKMEILHDFNLQVARKQSLCLIGPNGAGKSTILHSIFGFTNIFSGQILVGDGEDKRDITGLTAPTYGPTDGNNVSVVDDEPGGTVHVSSFVTGVINSSGVEPSLTSI